MEELGFTGAEAREPRKGHLLFMKVQSEMKQCSKFGFPYFVLSVIEVASRDRPGEGDLQE